MSRYIDADAIKNKAWKAESEACFYALEDVVSVTDIDEAPSIELVRCKDCSHRIVNKHYGEKGYMKLKAMCELDTGDIFQLGRHAEDDKWYCADAERK